MLPLEKVWPACRGLLAHRPHSEPGRVAVGLGAAVFLLSSLALSWWRWATYQYGTFDLAFYVQALWGTVHGHSTSSLLGVSLLGNHAEPIVYLALPLFALVPHPMLLPVLQGLALASMPFTARRVALRLGLSEPAATALALTTLLTPASGFIAVHEFHPEALAAPLLLLLYEAQQQRRGRAYALWFLLAVACKENVALLLVAWSAVHGWLERARPRAELARWYLLPALAAGGWVLCYGAVLSPALNGGRVDYWNLYSELGATPGAALGAIFTDPARLGHTLGRALRSGDLGWVSLASTAGLLLLRPRWLLIAGPVLLQHLLSWRVSEWSIRYHYAAPLVPLLWLAAAEACARWPRLKWLPWAPVAACAGLQAWLGPWWELRVEGQRWQATWWQRSLRAPWVAALQQDPGLSVLAGLPYLPHLATRPELHSLHLLLKGTQTLSLRRYEPDFTADAVLLDAGDGATFNRTAGYFHPRGTIAGEPLLGSEELLHRFLARHPWRAQSRNALTLLRRGDAAPAGPVEGEGVTIFPHTSLTRARLERGWEGAAFGVRLGWRYAGERQNLPWLRLELTGAGGTFSVPLGMAAPEAAGAEAWEERAVYLPPWVPAGPYAVKLIVYDQVRTLWRPQDDPVLLEAALGQVHAGP